MKPSLIVPCYRDCQRIALLECVGGGGNALFCCWWDEGFIFLLNISSGAKWNPVTVNPLCNKGLKARYHQSVCLNREACLCSSSSFDWEPDILKTSLKPHGCMAEDLCEPKRVYFTSQEQRGSNVDELCRICLLDKSLCQVRSYSYS